MIARDIVLVETSETFPEEYFAYFDYVNVGYMKYRSGKFKVWYLPNEEEVTNLKLIYLRLFDLKDEDYPSGKFPSKITRKLNLNLAKFKLAKELIKNKNPIINKN